MKYRSLHTVESWQKMSLCRKIILEKEPLQKRNYFHHQITTHLGYVLFQNLTNLDRSIHRIRDVQNVNVTYPRITAGREVFLTVTVTLTIDAKHERRTWTITGRTEQSWLCTDAVAVCTITTF